ncbi:MAG: hypothetical protein LBK82_17295, partial [Planctomycetaceae bacterium]|nr:hypothetical protein [Planctomycetaceae bacterium]
MNIKKNLLLFYFFLFSVPISCQEQSTGIDLWDSAIPYPVLTAIPTATGVTYSIVHQQTPDHRFLHEPRIAFHGDTLFVNFSNAEKNESDPDQKMRGHRSNDNGQTWSEVEVFASGFPDSRRHETAPLLSSGDKLWMFVGRYDNGSKNSLGM